MRPIAILGYFSLPSGATIQYYLMHMDNIFLLDFGVGGISRAGKGSNTSALEYGKLQD
jgi:hypothetical protein